MDRSVIAGPLGWSLAGGSAGVCAAMLYHADDSGRVMLEHSIPLAVVGAVGGALVGCLVAVLCYIAPRIRSTAIAISASAISAGMGGMAGWIVGDGLRSQMPWTRLYGECMAVGVLCGFLA